MNDGPSFRKTAIELIAGLLLSLPFFVAVLVRRVVGPRQGETTAPSRATAEPGADQETADDAEELDAGKPDSPGRRAFVRRLSLAVAGLGAMFTGVPVIGYLFSPVQEEDPVLWRPVGVLDDFPIGGTIKVEYLDPDPVPWSGIAARTAAWVRREGEEQFVAYSAFCTHVGCPVRWLADAQLFMCPCHGGAFFHDGTVAAGPPSEPLARYPVRVQANQVEIQTQPLLIPAQSGVAWGGPWPPGHGRSDSGPA